MTPAGSEELERSMERFLQWAHAQGWLYRMAPGRLAHFRRFLKQRGIERLDQVDTALLVDYQHRLLAHCSATTVIGYVSTLRALWRYLLRQGIVAEDVTEGLPLLRPDHFIPHLYGPEELLCIERASRMAIGQVHTPARRLCRWSRHAAFCLIRDCGLRVSEACRLVLEDYDPEARSLRIERTKFFKTRVIPLPRSTTLCLDRYLRHRMRMARDCPDLFVTTYGRRPKRNALEDPFRQMLHELGLYKPKRREGRTVFGSTNLHALRHSFAVRTLERWQSQGDDVEALLPLLSGYMGHDQVSYTATYLHLTPTLRQLASERFAELVLPSLDSRGRDGSEEK